MGVTIAPQYQIEAPATNYVKPAATISTVGKAYNYQPSVIQQAPAVASYVQPAASSVFNVIEAPTTNYVKPAATISTVGRTYQPQTVVQQPSYNYVQPAASSLFNVIDANGDGKISQTEFTNYITGATNYVQPAATNYVKPAATISTVGRAYNYQPSVI